MEWIGRMGIRTYGLAGVTAKGDWVQEVLSGNFGGDEGDGVGVYAGEPVGWELLLDEEEVHCCLVRSACRRGLDSGEEEEEECRG